MEMRISHSIGNGNGKDWELSHGNEMGRGVSHSIGNGNGKDWESDNPYTRLQTYSCQQQRPVVIVAVVVAVQVAVVVKAWLTGNDDSVISSSLESQLSSVGRQVSPSSRLVLAPRLLSSTPLLASQLVEPDSDKP